MRALVLRLDAPMMSFGSVIVDHHGFTDFFPGVSMLTGMIGNALGWHHGDFEQLQSLQNSVDFAARWDVRPHRVIDYHTVDLGSPKMSRPGWTTRGETEHRAGGPAAKFGTHQRYRHYLVDGLMTVALGVAAEGYPDLDAIKEAFERPARPLFLGRKTCMPARPFLDPVSPIMKGTDLLTILGMVPVWNREGVPEQESRETWLCWTPREGEDGSWESRLVYDLRDWHNQLPVGSRWRREGMIGG
ncbi:MAG TPA: type I-E CRISPR-associated protein Cas5/CasD [Firmicutes bacterium]|nr:type I-E CRISPR-associated protein Cas5/CasD [Bacillota bacterium]